MPAPSEYAGRLITEVPQAYLQRCVENAVQGTHTSNRHLLLTEWRRRHNLVTQGHYVFVAQQTQQTQPAPKPEPSPLVRMRVTLTPAVVAAVEKISGKVFGKGNHLFSRKLVQLLERALETEPQCAP